jgi:hypothetical protein
LEAEMAENYMKQYIELSNEFRKDNKSQEIIKKLYDFMDLLQKDENKDNKMVLVYVYTLLAYYKKAYDLYLKLYNENDRKQKAKLFDMEQMSKSHGDNFAIKLKKKPKINKEVNYSVDDFVEENIIGEYKNYVLNKTCIIFNQIFDNEPLEIKLYKDFVLSEYITQINNYIHWLGGECKTKLISYFNKNMAFVEEKADDEWYETLEIYSVSIIMAKNKKLCATIACGDNIFMDHILDIETEEDKIWSMNIDG